LKPKGIPGAGSFVQVPAPLFPMNSRHSLAVTMLKQNMNDSQSDLCLSKLASLCLIRFSGPDSSTFLQGQLTSDVRLLADGRTQLAAMNSPKGRVIAVLRLTQSQDSVFALLPAELAATVTEKLQRYVLRAKVDIRLESELVLTGVQGPPARLAETLRILAEGTGSGSETPWFAWAPDRRVIATTPERWAALRVGSGTAGPEEADNAWMRADILAGLPQVFAATSEAYVAQMLNLDLLDAISFNKGCYTGQEIITRAQHLGRIKRRLLHYGLEQGPAPELRTALLGDGAKVGEIAMSANDDDGARLLGVVTVEAAADSLQLEDGRIAKRLSLPYEVGAST